MKTLKKYDVSEAIFDSLLSSYSRDVEVVENIQDYFKGYQPKYKIYYDNKEYLIIREHLLAHIADFTEEEYQSVEDWRQVIVRKMPTVNNYAASIDGNRAWHYMVKILQKYYPGDKFEKQLSNFEAEYSEENKQVHFLFPASDMLYKFNNCVKYDINAAHHDALIEIFPKAKKDLIKLYNDRKEKPVYKAYVNYFVGSLVNHGHRPTYNWIVQRTTKMLKEAMNEVDGLLIYANTDGFIMQNPKKKLDADKAIGHFKEEYSGTVYVYQDKNYWCYQIPGETKGSIRYQVRDILDLSKGIVVHYNVSIKTNESGIKVQTLENITTEKVEIYEED